MKYLILSSIVLLANCSSLMECHNETEYKLLYLSDTGPEKVLLTSNKYVDKNDYKKLCSIGESISRNKTSRTALGMPPLYYYMIEKVCNNEISHNDSVFIYEDGSLFDEYYYKSDNQRMDVIKLLNKYAIRKDKLYPY